MRCPAHLSLSDPKRSTTALCFSRSSHPSPLTHPTWLRCSYGGDHGAIQTAVYVQSQIDVLIAIGFGGSLPQTVALMATPPASAHAYWCVGVSQRPSS